MSDVLPNNVFFLHIPKTGGNWVRRVIERSGVKKIQTNKISKHATYDLLSGVHGRPEPSRGPLIKYFCVVRHPILWYQSWYRYQHDRSWRNWGEEGNLLHWHCLTGINMKKQNDFNEFMTFINQKAP